VLRCLKCKKYAYKTHKCSVLSLVPVTHECRIIADMLFDLGVEPLSAAHFVTPVTDSVYKYYIHICIELRRDYPTNILGDLPTGWIHYTQTVSEDHIPLQVIGYSETFAFDGVLTVEGRVQEIVSTFEDYLGTFDPQSFKSVLTLMGI